jgi:hypothetical protein
MKGYPKPIKGNWGMPDKWAKEGIDAALFSEKQNSVYFFKKSNPSPVK